MIRPHALPVVILCAFAAVFQTACEKRADGQMHFLGEPDPAKKWKPPTAIVDFDTLYTQNCIACHGRGSTTSAAIAMDNQTYLNLVPADVLKTIIEHGVKGTRMPGFAESVGGGLTEKGDPAKGEDPEGQIGILVKGILAWKKPLDPAMGTLPAYAAPLGNAASGRALFAQSFAKDLPAVQTYLDPAFLGLVSDQYLRTLVIVGQPELGFPDFRNFIPGRPLTDQDVSDIVAWLVSNRK